MRTSYQIGSLGLVQAAADTRWRRTTSIRPMREMLKRLIVVGLLSSLLVVVPTTVAGAETVVDGCTAVPDSGPVFDFTEACNDHDRCYLERPRGDSWWDRRQCDRDFYRAMIDACQDRYPRRSQWFKRGSCYGVAVVYYLGVRVLGALAWDEGQAPALAEAA